MVQRFLSFVVKHSHAHCAHNKDQIIHDEWGPGGRIGAGMADSKLLELGMCTKEFTNLLCLIVRC